MTAKHWWLGLVCVGMVAAASPVSADMVAIAKASDGHGGDAATAGVAVECRGLTARVFRSPGAVGPGEGMLSVGDGRREQFRFSEEGRWLLEAGCPDVTGDGLPDIVAHRMPIDQECCNQTYVVEVAYPSLRKPIVIDTGTAFGPVRRAAWLDGRPFLVADVRPFDNWPGIDPEMSPVLRVALTYSQGRFTIDPELNKAQAPGAPAPFERAVPAEELEPLPAFAPATDGTPPPPMEALLARMLLHLARGEGEQAWEAFERTPLDSQTNLFHGRSLLLRFVESLTRSGHYEGLAVLNGMAIAPPGQSPAAFRYALAEVVANPSRLSEFIANFSAAPADPGWHMQTLAPTRAGQRWLATFALCPSDRKKAEYYVFDEAEQLVAGGSGAGCLTGARRGSWEKPSDHVTLVLDMGGAQTAQLQVRVQERDW